MHKTPNVLKIQPCRTVLHSKLSRRKSDRKEWRTRDTVAQTTLNLQN